MKISERDIEVLEDLHRSYIRGVNSRGNPIAYAGEKAMQYLKDRDDLHGEGWLMPMDFGGTNGSHHSATATRLAKYGLVYRYKGGNINYFKSRSKGSCLYRISRHGITILNSYKEIKNK